MFSLNPSVSGVVEPPIAEVKQWISGQHFDASRPLLDLAQAVPSYPPAAALESHLGALTGDFETAQYTEICGIAPLREALAAHSNDFYSTTRVSARNVLVTAGCNQAYCLAMMALARAGDEVILPLPYYFNHRMWLDALGVTTVHLPFRPDRNGVPDPQDAARRVTPSTRAIVLLSPANPTGALLPAHTLAEFRDLAARHGIALVLDETYKDFLPPDFERHALFNEPAWGDTVVQLYSFSKTFSLTGYRVGSIIAGEAFVEQVSKLMDCVSICTSRIAQAGALYALENLWPWASEKAELIAQRRNALLDVLASTDTGFEVVSTGAYFAYVRHPFRGESSAAVAKRLATESAVLCLPGSVFGEGQQDYLRFAVANLEVGQMESLGERLAALRS